LKREIQSLLASDLDQHNIEKILQKQEWVTSELAKARRAYAEARAQYILPSMKPSDWVTLEARVADIKAEVDELEGLKDAISARIGVALAWL
jgi:hypothetical protein